MFMGRKGDEGVKVVMVVKRGKERERNHRQREIKGRERKKERERENKLVEEMDGKERLEKERKIS